MADGAFEQLYTVTNRVAAVRAATTASLYGLPADARDDLEQELLLELWKKRIAFDPRRGGWRTFSEVVAANKMTSLVRTMCSRRSGRFKEQPIEWASSLAAPDGRNELRADVRRVLAGVSTFDRHIARSLTYRSPTETGRSMGVSRAKVYRAIGRLRAAFTLAGFDDRRGVRRQEISR